MNWLFSLSALCVLAAMVAPVLFSMIGADRNGRG